MTVFRSVAHRLKQYVNQIISWPTSCCKCRTAPRSLSRHQIPCLFLSLSPSPSVSSEHICAPRHAAPGLANPCSLPEHLLWWAGCGARLQGSERKRPSSPLHVFTIFFLLNRGVNAQSDWESPLALARHVHIQQSCKNVRRSSSHGTGGKLDSARPKGKFKDTSHVNSYPHLLSLQLL